MRISIEIDTHKLIPSEIKRLVRSVAALGGFEIGFIPTGVRASEQDHEAAAAGVTSDTAEAAAAEVTSDTAEAEQIKGDTASDETEQDTADPEPEPETETPQETPGPEPKKNKRKGKGKGKPSKAAPEKEVSIDTLRKKALRKSKELDTAGAEGNSMIFAVIEGFGFRALADIPDSKRADVLAAIEQLEATSEEEDDE